MQEVEEKIISLEPVHKNYKSFCMILKAAAKKYVLRGFRKNFTPYWLPESEDLLKQYEATGDPDIATELIDSLDAARRQCWHETLDDLNFTHSSRKAWTLLRYLDSAAPALYTPPPPQGVSKCCSFSPAGKLEGRLFQRSPTRSEKESDQVQLFFTILKPTF